MAKKRLLCMILCALMTAGTLLSCSEGESTDAGTTAGTENTAAEAAAAEEETFCYFISKIYFYNIFINFYYSSFSISLMNNYIISFYSIILICLYFFKFTFYNKSRSLFKFTSLCLWRKNI